MILIDISTFIGRLHPLVVHLPIGFLLLAVLFNLLSYSKRYRALEEAVPITLWVGFIAAVLACVFGYILSLSGNYDSEILQPHKYSGIALAVITGFLILIDTAYVKKQILISRKVFSGILTGLIILMSYSGHQGASLTHGNDYLSLQVLLEQHRPKPLSVEKAIVYEDVVAPILKSKCAQCHRDGKTKGGLSVTTIQALLKGGKNGEAIVAGNPDLSEIIKRVTLDPSHEDFMPTDGKTPLTKNEISIIKWWIKDGQATAGKSLVSVKNHSEIKPLVAGYLGFGGDAAAESRTTAFNQRVNPDIPALADTNLISGLRKSGITVRYMLKNPVMLDITFPATSNLSQVKPQLLKLSKNIIWLNFSETNISAADLDFLKSCANLEKLRLDKTSVTDDVRNHLIGLNHLAAVNLSQTRITAKTIETLKRNPSIRKIYIWGSKADVNSDSVVIN